jgi:Ca-activated chloride channel family protein
MAELQLLRPWWLLGLLPLLGAWFWLWRSRDQAARLRRVVDPHLLPHLLVGGGEGRGPKPIHFLGLVWALGALAMAGPSWRAAPAPFPLDPGLVIVLKASASMRASDVQPSRLERARHKLQDLLALRRGDTTGLIVYSGSAHLVMPLTRDERIIPVMLEELTPDLMPADGDALADALVAAQDLLQRSEMPGSVLVVADSVAGTQADAVAALDYPLPVQFLSVQALDAQVDAGLARAAAALGAGVQSLSADERDVTRIGRRARGLVAATQGGADGQRPEDAGYFLLPLIVLLALAWSRRGWVVR